MILTSVLILAVMLLLALLYLEIAKDDQIQGTVVTVAVIALGWGFLHWLFG